VKIGLISDTHGLGSAGPRRFNLPITIGYLTITEGTATAEIRNLA
jgi:hypothetical protein